MPSIQQKTVGSPVPIIDFSLFRNAISPEQKRATAKAVFDGFRTVGFVYLINHGIPLQKIEECFQWSKKFFALASEEKMKCPRNRTEGGAYNQGYFGGGGVQASEHRLGVGKAQGNDRTKTVEPKTISEAPPTFETFELCRDDSDLSPNAWPSRDVLPGFREFCVDYYSACREAQMDILHAIALGMNLEEDYFDPYHSDSVNQLRLLHYPPIEESALLKGEKERIAAHTDIRTLTILVQDECGGLEIEDPYKPGVFTPAPPIKGALIVNIGDFLMRWSNDVLKSPLHRVRAPPPRETELVNEEGAHVRMTPSRYSIPYFCTANMDATIDCIPGCWSEEMPKKYEPITSREYVDMTMKAKY